MHAGWRGTLAGIAAKTVDYFKSRYGVDAGDLEVALGPSIGVCCYEVNNDVAAPLMKKWGALTTPSIAMKNGKPHINLSRLNRDILRAAGVPGTQLFQIGPCTVLRGRRFLFLPPRRRRDRPADRRRGLVAVLIFIAVSL